MGSSGRVWVMCDGNKLQSCCFYPLLTTQDLWPFVRVEVGLYAARLRMEQDPKTPTSLLAKMVQYLLISQKFTLQDTSEVRHFEPKGPSQGQLKPYQNSLFAGTITRLDVADDVLKVCFCILVLCVYRARHLNYLEFGSFTIEY
jgi:hypothetical protein